MLKLTKKTISLVLVVCMILSASAFTAFADDEITDGNTVVSDPVTTPEPSATPAVDPVPDSTPVIEDTATDTPTPVVEDTATDTPTPVVEDTAPVADSMIINGSTATIEKDGTYVASGSETIVVNDGVKAELTLSNAAITAVGSSAISLGSGSDVTITLDGTSTVSADPASISAGIYVPQDASLTIKGEGTLNVKGGQYGAGIGSVKDVVSGKITVDSGIINAVGGDRGAGIGSGYHASAGATTINGGTITAIGSGCGAGIGTGYGTSGGGEGKVGTYSGGDITINGGSIKAASFNMDFTQVDPMNPSCLVAFDTNSFAAGIGGGYGSSSGNITINGGDITAIGSCGGCGIGSGRGTSKAKNYDKDAFFSNINIGGDAKIVAMATDDVRNYKGGGAAIGTGRGTHTGGTISITGNADVTAIASPFAAAIGAGSTVSPVDGTTPCAESITITDGVKLYAVSDGSRYAIDTACGTKSYPTIEANIQQVLFDANVLNEAEATNFDLRYNGATEKQIVIPAKMKSVAFNVANQGKYYLKSGDKFGMHVDANVVYENNGTLAEHNCVDLCEFTEEITPSEVPGSTPPLEPIIATAPIALENDFAYIFGRNDTMMAPDSFILRDEACAVLYRLLKQNHKLGDFVYDKTNTPYFEDLTSGWDRSSVEYMAYIGVYNKDDKRIGPINPIMRKEAFRLFALALKFTEQKTLTYEQYASILVDQGYVCGDENGNLNLDDEITRAEFCKIYNMIIGRDKMELASTDGKVVNALTYGFNDISENEWYYDIMLKATSAYSNGKVDIAKRGTRGTVDDE